MGLKLEKLKRKLTRQYAKRVKNPGHYLELTDHDKGWHRGYNEGILNCLREIEHLQDSPKVPPKKRR